MNTTAQQRQLVQEHFDDYATDCRWQSYYDTTSKSYSYPFQLRKNCFRKFMKKLNSRRVLDVGCGSGDFIIGLPSSVEKYHGFDISSDMIAAAKDLRKRQIESVPDDKSVEFEVSDVLSFNPKKKFDYVFASGLTEYFEDIQLVMDKLAEFVDDDGYLAVQTPNRNFFRWEGKHKIYSEEKGFAHHRLSCDELDQFAKKSNLEKVAGKFVNFTLPLGDNVVFIKKIFNVFANSFLPRNASDKYASMYIGLYRKI